LTVVYFAGRAQLWKVDNGDMAGARVLRSGILVALALLASLPVESQNGPRPVTGMVTDKRGNTLPGAVVQLENTRSLVVQSYITQKDGRYHFDGLSEDVDYTLRARYRNYWSDSKTLSKFNGAARPEVNLIIPIE
jgi:Carboxypeptidase regulatory-like domain